MPVSVDIEDDICIASLGSSIQVSWGETKCWLCCGLLWRPSAETPPKFIQSVDRFQFIAAIGPKSLICAGWQPGVTFCFFHVPPPSTPPSVVVCCFFQDSRSVSQMSHLLWKSGPFTITPVWPVSQLISNLAIGLDPITFIGSAHTQRELNKSVDDRERNLRPEFYLPQSLQWWKC